VIILRYYHFYEYTYVKTIVLSQLAWAETASSTQQSGLRNMTDWSGLRHKLASTVDIPRSRPSRTSKVNPKAHLILRGDNPDPKTCFQKLFLQVQGLRSPRLLLNGASQWGNVSLALAGSTRVLRKIVQFILRKDMGERLPARLNASKEVRLNLMRIRIICKAASKSVKSLGFIPAI